MLSFMPLSSGANVLRNEQRKNSINTNGINCFSRLYMPAEEPIKQAGKRG